MDLGSLEDFIILFNYFDYFLEKLYGLMKYVRGLLISMFWEFFRYYVKVKRNVIDKNYLDNYWVLNLIDGKVKCYYFEINVCICCSLKVNEEKFNGFIMLKRERKDKEKSKVELYGYMLLFFNFLFLYKNLNDVVDMVDGVRIIK